MRLLLLPLLTILALISAAVPVLANDEQDCFQGNMSALRISGCSAMIQRNPDDVTAYHNRADAYRLAGDIDSAIADYTKVIEIVPDNPSAYENRGLAYASNGDYAHAVADETKANELLAKATAHPTVITPKTPAAHKKPKATTSAANTPKRPTKTKAIPKEDNKVGNEAANGGWWSWLWGNSANQGGGKNVKP